MISRYIEPIYRRRAEARSPRGADGLAAPRGVVDNSRTLRKPSATHPISGAGGAGRVDYSLARKATILAYREGRLSRFDICDAHPDLIRAGKFCGTTIPDACPVCERAGLVLVAYVFSDEFPKNDNGRVWDQPDVGPLLAMHEARLYTVEVCLGCSWNHLRSQVMFSNGRTRRAQGARGGGAKRRGRAST
jgi:hypothetical protein